ncbi:MAG: hypothetical protein ACRESJ_02335, partial [Pseudomonas sp.]|uniref:hypothetical protein n=1 Tax=Pseudomonas sp. TaxID=306 RepID=UPI003D6DD6BC
MGDDQNENTAAGKNIHFLMGYCAMKAEFEGLCPRIRPRAKILHTAEAFVGASLLAKNVNEYARILNDRGAYR